MKAEDIEEVSVIGTGTMGKGIALSCARAGYNVKVTRHRVELLPKAMEKIRSYLETMEKYGALEKGVDSVMENIETCETLEETVSEADFVFESVVEDFEIKRDLYENLCEMAPPRTILATNTSSFSIKEIAEGMKRPEKIVGAHWWNPAHLMPLVEVVKAENTSEETIEVTKEFVGKLGKVSVECKDKAGFLGVRIQAAIVVECMRMLEEGIASAEDIDKATKLTLGLRLPIMGPLEIVDLGGLDIFLNAYDYMGEKLGDRFTSPDLIREKVKSEDLGIKSGEGFYSYEDKSVDDVVEERDKYLIERLKEIEENK